MFHGIFLKLFFFLLLNDIQLYDIQLYDIKYSYLK